MARRFSILSAGAGRHHRQGGPKNERLQFRARGGDAADYPVHASVAAYAYHFLEPYADAVAIGVGYLSVNLENVCSRSEMMAIFSPSETFCPIWSLLMNVRVALRGALP